MVDYSPLERIASPLILLPNLIITSIVWIHAFKTLPKTSYSYLIQSAFACNVLAIITDIVYMYFRFSGNRISAIYITHSFANLLQFTCYMFGQTSLFYIFLPCNEIKSRWFSVSIRVFVAISTIVCSGCYVYRLIMTETPTLNVVSTTSYYATSLVDVVGMAYIVASAYRRIRTTSKTFHQRLMTVFMVSLVIYTVGMGITYVPVLAKGPYFMMVRDAIQMLYVPSSYMCIIVIQQAIAQMHQAENDRKPNNVESQRQDTQYTPSQSASSGSPSRSRSIVSIVPIPMPHNSFVSDPSASVSTVMLPEPIMMNTFVASTSSSSTSRSSKSTKFDQSSRP